MYFIFVKDNLNLKGINSEFDSILNTIDESHHSNKMESSRAPTKNVKFDIDEEAPGHDADDSSMDLDAFENADEEEDEDSFVDVKAAYISHEAALCKSHKPSPEAAADSKPAARRTPFDPHVPKSNPSPTNNFGILKSDYEPFQNDNIHVVKKVKYSHHLSDWMDNKYNKMLSIFVHLPSGIKADDVHVKVCNGGMSMSLYQKVPAIFKNSNFIMERYDCSRDDIRVVGVGETINRERRLVNQGLCDENYYEMSIDLPFSCYERPVKVLRAGTYCDVDMFRFKHDNPQLRRKGTRYYGCFVDLCALNKNQTRTGYAVGRSK